MTVLKDTLNVNRILKAIVLIISLQQITSIFRAMGIYDTAVLFVYIKAVFAIVVLQMILLNIMKLKLTYSLSLLLIFTFLSGFMGFYYNDLGRDFLADFLNALFFVLFISYIYSAEIDWKAIKIDGMIKTMTVTFILSILMYYGAIISGLKVISVGKTSMAFSFPFLYYFFEKKKKSTIFYAFFIFLSTKRGVILSVIIGLFFTLFFKKGIPRRMKVLAGVLTLLLAAVMVGVSYSPNTLVLMPSILRAFTYKLMLINPFSPHNEILKNYRIYEAYSSIQPLIETPMLIFTGVGMGYTYNVYDYYGNLSRLNEHNSHFTPFTVATRFGVFYFLVLYNYLITMIYKSFKSVNLNRMDLIVLTYVVTSLVNSLTAFTLYADYLLIFSLGYLANRVRMKYREDFIR